MVEFLPTDVFFQKSAQFCNTRVSSQFHALYLPNINMQCNAKYLKVVSTLAWSNVSFMILLGIIISGSSCHVLGAGVGKISSVQCPWCGVV